MFRPSLEEGISGCRLLQAEVHRGAMILFVYDFPDRRAADLSALVRDWPLPIIGQSSSKSSQVVVIMSCIGGRIGEGQVAALGAGIQATGHIAADLLQVGFRQG